METNVKFFMVIRLFLAVIATTSLASLGVACSPSNLEPSSLATMPHLDGGQIVPTVTPTIMGTSNVVFQPAQNELITSSEGYIDIYKNILQGYEDVLSDQTLPQGTRDALIAEMAVIQVESTQWAAPAPTFDPNIDVEDFAATLEADLATLIAIDELTMTPEPTSTKEFGFIIDPDYAFYSRWPNGVARGAWRGYVNGIETFVQTGGIRYSNYNMGMVGIVISNEKFG